LIITQIKYTEYAVLIWQVKNTAIKWGKTSPTPMETYYPFFEQQKEAVKKRC